MCRPDAFWAVASPWTPTYSRIQTSVTRNAKALPTYHGKGGLLTGIDARSNRALTDAADLNGIR
jgi:hypothetical protein